MKIDSVLNRKYNAILSEIRKGIGMRWSLKEYREVMKMADPFFIRVNGVPISMKDITQDQMSNHISFMRMYAVRKGFVPKDTTSDEEAEFRSIKILARAFDVKEDGDYIQCRVVCSSCGGATARILTRDRYDEICKIENGQLFEQVGTNSFKCIDCHLVELQKNRHKTYKEEIW